MSIANISEDKVKHRAVIEVLTLEGNNATQIHDRMSTVYGDSAPSYSTICRWNNEFKRGRKSLEDDMRSGRPATGATPENILLIKKFLNNDRRVSIRLMQEMCALSYGTIKLILHEHLNMRKVCARWVPRMLSRFEKQTRVDTSNEVLRMFEENPEEMPFRIITEDETWLHHYDPETKSQSSQWKTPSEPTLKFRVQPSAGKVLATIFWDAEGVILLDFLERGNTINGPYYSDLINRLRKNLPQTRRGLIARKPLLLHDNAPAHTAELSLAAAREAKLILLPHPPYSPDLAPSDFYLFPKLKKFLKGKKFSNDTEVMDAAENWLWSQPNEFYLEGILELKSRLQKCIALSGDYVEKL